MCIRDSDSADVEAGLKWAYNVTTSGVQTAFSALKESISPYSDTPDEAYCPLTLAFKNELTSESTRVYPSFTHGTALPLSLIHISRLIGAGIPRGRGRAHAAAQGGHHPGGLRIGILRRGLVFAFALNILIQLLMPVHAAMARGGVGGILIRPGFGIKMISHAAYSL